MPKGETMSEQENLQLARDMFDALNAQNLDRAAGLIDESLIWESDAFPEPIRGPEGFTQAMQQNYEIFPDLRFAIDEQIASGDFVVTLYRVIGTQKGEYMGVAPTNNVVTTNNCAVAEIRGGKVIRLRTYIDRAATLEQIGVDIEAAVTAATA